MARSIPPLFIIIAGLLACIKVEGQQANASDKAIMLEFAGNGKLSSFPAAILRDKNEICTKALIPQESILNQVSQFRNMLVKTFEELTNQKTKDQYLCYFKATKFKLSEYLENLKDYIEFLDEKNFSKLTPEDIRKFKNDDEYVPMQKFLNNLLDSQYMVKFFRGQAEVASEQMKITYDAEQQCYIYKGQCRKVKDITCNPCGAQSNQLSVQLIQTDPLSKTLADWFEIQNAALKTIDPEIVIDALGQIAILKVDDGNFDSEFDKLDSLRQWFPYWFWFTGGEITFDPLSTVTSEFIAKKKSSIVRADASIEALNQQKRYLENVLTKVPAATGELELIKYLHGLGTNLNNQADSAARLKQANQTLLTARPVPSAERIKEINDHIRELDLLIPAIKQQKAQIDIALSKISTNVGQFELFRIIQDMSAEVSVKIEALTKAKEEAKKIIDKKAGSFEYLQVKRLLNNLIFVKSTKRFVHPQIQFDAANSYDYTARSKRQLHRVSELPENESGIVLVHNIDSSAVLTFSHTTGTFKDDPEFTELMTELLAKIDLISLTPGEIKNVQGFVKSFFSDADIKGIAPDKCDDAIIKPKIKAVAKKFVDAGLTFSYKQSVFSNAVPTLAIFRSQREAVAFKSTAPLKDSITATQKRNGRDTVVMARVIKVGKLRFVHLAAGIAVTDKPVTVTSVDTLSSGFRMTSTDNKARAIIGFKVYPFQNYNRDRWLLPRYPIRRISIFGGFEMLHPLNNFYIGGGYDIVPGLTFSAGKNYYLKTSYKIENNTITDTYRNYDSQGLYYSIMVDPALFIKFVKLFFKL